MAQFALQSVMQIAYRARNAADAEAARCVLAAAGILAHIPDPPPAGSLDETFRVLVDNVSVDPARRALDRWVAHRDQLQKPEAE
jgi:hypothetical protein